MGAQHEEGLGHLICLDYPVDPEALVGPEALGQRSLWVTHAMRKIVTELCQFPA